MAIDLVKEKESKLTSQDMYDIIAFSVEAANDNGFMNSFIFNRALYLFAAIVLYPEKKEEFSHIVANNVNSAWDKMIEDGVIEDMIATFPTELEMLAENGRVWFDEYAEYAHSARGLLDTIQMFTGDIVKAAAEQLQSASVQSGVQEVMEIADKWGMNNEVAKFETLKELPETDNESVFA